MQKPVDEVTWVFPKENVQTVTKIVQEFNIHPITARVLCSRGYTSKPAILDFLYAKLPNLISPEKFNDIGAATRRIWQCMKNNENILIYGDNDVDGITATTLLTEFFRKLKCRTYYYVPNRNNADKSILLNAVNYAKEKNCTLIITVDCGITAAYEVDEVKKQNIDVIITDHHEPTDKVPHSIATLNPKVTNSRYPNKDITGVGVAFKLAHAMLNFLLKKCPEVNVKSIDLKDYLDLVALGTIADMGALTGENRIFVRYGLEIIRKSRRVGLIQLIKQCELRPSEVNVMAVASKIAPRINSLGRIDDPLKGVSLLLEGDRTQASALALDLDQMNQARQKIERENYEHITTIIEQNPDIIKKNAIVIASDKLHPGVIPIISTKISKLYNRPTVIISIEAGFAKGSVRTISNFKILSMLKEVRDCLENFGGHDFAAGLTLKVENIDLFTKKFIEAVDQHIKPDDIVPKIHLDAKIDFEELTFDLLESLSLLEPYGIENPSATLYCEAYQASSSRIVGKNHLKLYLEQGSRRLEGIAFNKAYLKDYLKDRTKKLMVCFTPQMNTNKTNIQLQIKEVKLFSE
jgi:single-stranded-DNA-specific exonuclease